MSNTENANVVTISGVRALLDLGKTRKEIAAHYGQTEAAMKRAVWNHPKLKNLKAKKQDNIVLEDDVEDIEAVAVETSETIEATEGRPEMVEGTLVDLDTNGSTEVVPEQTTAFPVSEVAAEAVSEDLWK